MDESSKIECLVEQTVPEEVSPNEVLTSKPKYGFGNQFSDVFKGFAVSFVNMYCAMHCVIEINQFNSPSRYYLSPVEFCLVLF